MQPVAHVKELWRYPVKSLGGETLTRGFLTNSGMAGDRCWAVVDADGEIKSARQWSKLIQMTACFSKPQDSHLTSYLASVPDVTIQCPDGTAIQSRTHNANTALAEFLEQECRLEPLRPPSATDFYVPPKARDMSNLDAELDRQEGEGDFDFSQTPEEIFKILRQYMTPPGTFFDSFPLHLISTQSLDYLGTESPADADLRRFRPNVLLDFVGQAAGKPEFDLLGSRLQIGDSVVRFRAKTIRCRIPSRAQPLLGLDKDPEMTRAMVKLFERHIGVYASIETEGQIRVGDPVFVIP